MNVSEGQIFKYLEATIQDFMFLLTKLMAYESHFKQWRFCFFEGLTHQLDFNIMYLHLTSVVIIKFAGLN